MHTATVDTRRPQTALGGHIETHDDAHNDNEAHCGNAAGNDHTAGNLHVSGSAEPFAKPDHKAKRHGKPRGPKNNGPKNNYRKFPREPRLNEVVGGGFFVFRRGDETGRISPNMWPYEHGSRESAKAEADRLAAKTGGRFQVFGPVDEDEDDYAVGDVVTVGFEAAGDAA